MKKWINKIRWFLIFLLLLKKERILLTSTLGKSNDYAIENYAMSMGETYSEYIFELRKIVSYI